MNTLSADLSILWPALIAGILVSLSHVPLGRQVLDLESQRLKDLVRVLDARRPQEARS